MRLTPSMQQYTKLKKAYPDAILLFQMGDFYETFFDDAKILANTLGIALTSREKGQNIPMAGFPMKALDTYLPKLVKQGYKVAIANQVEDPKNAKGLVERKVVEVVTAATLITEHQDAESPANQYIGAIYLDGNLAHLAYTDILSSDVFITPVHISELRSKVEQIGLKELIIIDKQTNKLVPLLEGSNIIKTPVPPISVQEATQLVTEHFMSPNYLALGLDNQVQTIPIAMLLIYIQFLKGTIPENLKNIVPVTYKNRMYLDAITLRNLDVLPDYTSNPHTQSLFKIFNHTATNMGARKLYKELKSPLTDITLIKKTQHQINYLRTDSNLSSLFEILRRIPDLERLTALIGLRRITPRQALSVKHALQNFNQIDKDVLKNLNIPPDLQKHAKEIIELVQFYIQEDLEPSIINPENFPEIKKYAQLAFNAESLMNEIVETERKKLGLDKIKLGFNKVFGYFIEVPKSLTKQIPEYFIRKQTLVNAERYILPKMKELEQEILVAQERLQALENQIFQEFKNRLLKHIKQLIQIHEAIGHIDFILNGALAMDRLNLVLPQFNKKPSQAPVIIESGRHPIVEHYVESFVPNSLELVPPKRFVIITGPNMGGKSTFIRQVALIQILAQIGYPVPAEHAQLNIHDRIFARVGASDNLSQGMSTFMVEMSEVSNILKNATEKSLIILDEVGRGTSTWEGLALAYAISEYLIEELQATTLFATHYHELTTLEHKYPNVCMNLKVDVIEQSDNVYFPHTISKGTAQKSYGIHIAKMVNLPEKILKNASDILMNLEQQRIHIVPTDANKQNVRQPQNTGQGMPSVDKHTTTTPAQLQLLNPAMDKAVQEILKTLKNIDINNLTPLQALNLLQKLQNSIVH